MYLITVPKFLRAAYPKGIWDKKDDDSKEVYLTFDDGPHPEVTPFVLDLLKHHQAKATFFCVGNNVAKYPEIYERILNEGHRVGNHTQNHLNGWKCTADKYLQDIETAASLIDTHLFRPPYGRIKKRQADMLADKGMEIIYWSLLSGDFDIGLSSEKCWQNVGQNVQPGDIVVFHDSGKARTRLEYALPKTLELCVRNGWELKSL